MTRMGTDVQDYALREISAVICEISSYVGLRSIKVDQGRSRSIKVDQGRADQNCGGKPIPCAHLRTSWTDRPPPAPPSALPKCNLPPPGPMVRWSDAGRAGTGKDGRSQPPPRRTALPGLAVAPPWGRLAPRGGVPGETPETTPGTGVLPIRSARGSR